MLLVLSLSFVLSYWLRKIVVCDNNYLDLRLPVYLHFCLKRDEKIIFYKVLLYSLFPPRKSITDF